VPFIGTDVQKVEFGWPIGMPFCRPLGQGLYEVRSDISDRRIARIIFIVRRNQMVLLHGFINKIRKSSKADIDLALRRKRQVLAYDDETG